MSLADYQAKALPNLVFYCDLSHGFDELLVMADSRFISNAKSYYFGAESADPEMPASWTVYRTLQVTVSETVELADGTQEMVTRLRQTTFKPSRRTWEYADSISFYCRACGLKPLKIDKSNLALWLDPLIESGTLSTGSSGDFLVSLASVWQQFEGIEKDALRLIHSAKRNK